jgi:hypothetical protein
MKRFRLAVWAGFLALVTFGSQAAITPPSGAVPSGLPSRMMVGLFEEWGGTWLRDSAVPWDVRYAYFVKGWANNWGWGAHDGSMATAFFNECSAHNFIPAVQFYQLHGESGGGEDQFLAKTQSASTMASYFSDFKLLMQRAKEFNKPVVVMIEADGTGFLQSQSNQNPNTYSAIAASGLPELAGLPNTVAGWGLAFLQIRKAVGANNVVLGMHISGWASGKDIAHYSVTDPLQPEVDKVYNFLAPLGLSANQTGTTYDFLVGDPLDRDADFYRLNQGVDRWWDASDSASINSKSFNRYAEWLRLWNVKSGKRWLLWQIPLGNSNHLNVYNNGGSRQGYKDNRTEYFFGSSSRAHLEKFASSGVFGLLFGAGAGGQSSYQNDTYSDGQLFMKSRAGAFLKAGGLPIPSGSTTTPPPTNPPPPLDATDYNFEADAQGWQRSGAPIASVARSTTQKYAGASSLAVRFNGSGSATVRVANPAAKAGQSVTFRIYLPSGARLTSVQPFVLQGAAGGWRWTGNWQPLSALRQGAWNTITVQVPANAALLSSLGVEFTTSGAYSGTVYVDSVNF